MPDQPDEPREPHRGGVDDLEAIREEAEEASGTDAQHVIYEEGWSIRTFIGTLFVAFVMLPGAIYLGLVSGTELGGASEWVTIVLFAEVARRSFMPLKRQEIYVLFYVASALVGLNADLGISGGDFGNLIWNGYLHIAPQATGTPIVLNGHQTTISRAIPTWVVPPEESSVWVTRTFFNREWLVPIGLMLIGTTLSRLSWITGGYALFRLTSDVERLPFPYAPVNAAGATALSEAGSREESWRWRVFSIGAMIGLIFGFFYLGIPIFTGVVLPQPLMLIKIPFIDLTPNTEGILPGAATTLTGDLGAILLGFVLPYTMVVGTFVSSFISQLIVNPILQQNGMLPTWHPGANAIWTRMATELDVWMSVDIGLKISVAIIGIFMAISILVRYVRGRGMGAQALTPPPGRGDFNWKWAVALFLIAQLAYTFIAHRLVPLFPLWFLFFFALVYTPLISYVSARMYGLTGRGVGLPYLREAAFIKSGYRGIDIWFMPVALHDVGWAAQRFREVELTGTRFTSIIKAEIVMLPVLLLASFIFWAFFWYTSAIPSSQFPYAQMFWPLRVTYRVLWMSATVEGGGAVKQFLGAIRANTIIPSVAAGLLAYAALTAAKVPVLFFYGLVGGVGQMMHGALSNLIGALLGRYYFAKRFGVDEWHRYAPVLLAGFSCGMGLIAMVAIALGLITKSVSFLPF
jgi:hypothetical protein